jgi:hypothetical protein
MTFRSIATTGPNGQPDCDAVPSIPDPDTTSRPPRCPSRCPRRVRRQPRRRHKFVVPAATVLASELLVRHILRKAGERIP